jgi:hypothetical protein
MVNTRRKRNNKQKNNTQKKRRNKQRKRDNRRRKLIMKKMFGGVDDIYRGPMVGKGSFKKVYTYNKSPRIDDTLLVEIEIDKSYEDFDYLISEAKLENMLLRQLYELKKVPVVEVSRYTEKKEENKTIISYIIEECGSNIVMYKKEYKIFGDLLLSGDTDKVRPFFDKIIQCSIFKIEQIQDGEVNLDAGLYLNKDCTPANFCYQGTDVKVMDVGIQHFYQIESRFEERAKLYVFILYCGIIVRHYDTNPHNKDIICDKLKQLSLDLFSTSETIQVVFTSVGNNKALMFMLLHYLLYVTSEHEDYTKILNQGLTSGRMRSFLFQYMAPDFFPNVIEIPKKITGRRGRLPQRKSTPTRHSAEALVLQSLSVTEAPSSVQTLPPIKSK